MGEAEVVVLDGIGGFGGIGGWKEMCVRKIEVEKGIVVKKNRNSS